MSVGELEYKQNNHKEDFQFQLSADDAYDARCGEVFITLQRELVLHCSLCDDRYASFDFFIEHLSTQHYNEEKQNVDEDDNVVGSEIDRKLIWEEDPNTEEDASQDHDINSYNGHIKKYNSDYEEVHEEYLEEIEQVVIESTLEFNDREEFDALEEVDGFDRKIKEQLELKNDEHLNYMKADHNVTNENKTIVENFDDKEETDDFYVEDCTDQMKIKKPASPRKERNHNWSRRRRVPDKMFDCETCKKKFDCRYKLVKHAVIHSEERKHKCHICNFAFKDYSNLVSHIKRHTDQKKYDCDICSKKFFTRTESMFHRRVHTGERPFVCSFCGLTFITSGGLSGHAKRHITVPEYQCTYCKKEFYKNSDLRDHILVHTKERNFACSICSHRFPRRKSLLRHMKLHTRSISSAL